MEEKPNLNKQSFSANQEKIEISIEEDKRDVEVEVDVLKRGRFTHRFRRIVQFIVIVPLTIIQIALDIGAVFILYKVLEPITFWYLTKSPIRGVDTFLSATYVHYILKWHEYLRPEGFKYFWFSGYPFALDYPSTYFLAMIPFVKRFGLIFGVMNFAVFALLLLVISSYLLFHEVSKNRAVALVLAAAVGLSANIYRQMVWAGSIPYFTSQAFLPLVAYLLVRFLNTRNYRWLFLSSLVAGIGITGHPQPFLNVILPFSFLLLLFYGGKDDLKFSKRIFDMVKFFGLFFLVGLPQIMQNGSLNLISNVFSTITVLFVHVGKLGVGVGTEQLAKGAIDLVNYNKNQFLLVFSGTQKILWYAIVGFLALWVLTLIIHQKKARTIFSIMPFALFLGYEIGVIFLFSRGVDVLVNHWNKALWPVPIAAGAFACALFGQASVGLERFEKLKLFKIFKIGWVAIVSLVVLFVGYVSFPPSVISDFVNHLNEMSSPSSPYPNVLNVKISDQDRLELARKLTPDFIDPNDKNKRLYAVDATINLAWSSMFDMPLARGYIDPPIANTGRWGLFWLDSVLGPSGKGQESSLMLDWKVPKEVVSENAKFLLDWNAVYYVLGNYQSENPTAIAKNLLTSDIFEKNTEVKVPGIITRYELTPDLKPRGEVYYPDRFSIMNYYKVKEELVSPVISANRASAVLLIGDDSAYDTIYRFLGMKNLNSQKVVVATRSKFIDDYSLSELKKFDAVILYRYDYHRGSRAWKLIGDYLKDGGKVYIDTGPEGRESQSTNLPDFFPFKRDVREDIGRDWKVQKFDDVLTKNIDFSKFSPLLFDNEAWNVSHPESVSDLNSQAHPILANRDTLIAASIPVGSGTLLWTGFNLPYHVIREYNRDEANFLYNLITSLVDLSEKRVGFVSYNWISPEKREVETLNARAVLFKEENFPNWKAKSNTGQKLIIYKAGPTYPGYMYVPFFGDQKVDKVTFSFRSSLRWWIFQVVSAVSVIFLVDQILTFGIISRVVNKFLSRGFRPTSSWWRREDEE